MAVNHPAANGLVERYNGVIKAGLRKLRVACSGGEWYEFLDDVIAGLRMLPGVAGVSPFLAVYKQEPH